MQHAVGPRIKEESLVEESKSTPNSADNNNPAIWLTSNKKESPNEPNEDETPSNETCTNRKDESFQRVKESKGEAPSSEEVITQGKEERFYRGKEAESSLGPIEVINHDGIPEDLSALTVKEFDDLQSSFHEQSLSEMQALSSYFETLRQSLNEGVPCTPTNDVDRNTISSSQPTQLPSYETLEPPFRQDYNLRNRPRKSYQTIKRKSDQKL